VKKEKEKDGLADRKRMRERGQPASPMRGGKEKGGKKKKENKEERADRKKRKNALGKKTSQVTFVLRGDRKGEKKKRATILQGKGGGGEIKQKVLGTPVIRFEKEKGSCAAEEKKRGKGGAGSGPPAGRHNHAGCHGEKKIRPGPGKGPFLSSTPFVKKKGPLQSKVGEGKKKKEKKARSSLTNVKMGHARLNEKKRKKKSGP